MQNDGNLRVPLTEIEQNCPKTTCLVTGASGYVGSAIVKRLLACGHGVHATSRDVKKLQDLYSLPGARDQLECFECELTYPGSFSQAIKGVTHVFHVASPVIVQIKRSEVEQRLLRPAVQGVENVLASCNAEPSVRRVILTSSVGAMAHDFWEKGKDHRLCEDDWNITSSPDLIPYKYSKVQAEKKAWEIESQQTNSSHQWRLVVICSAMCLGPPVLDHNVGEATSMVHDMLAGKYKYGGFPPICMPVVDIEDTAKAHIVAAFNDNAQGRYLCAAEGHNLRNLLETAGRIFDPTKKYMGPQVPRFVSYLYFKTSKKASWDFIGPKLDKIPLINNAKARRDLEIEFYDPIQSVVDMLHAASC